jgi:hypothetical protein
MSTINSYIRKKIIFYTPIFYKYILQGRYELSSQLLHFVNNKISIFEGKIVY